MNNPINHILLYSKSLTKFQKWAFIVFSVCMAIDSIVTAWGYFFHDGFYEANVLFRQFFHDPVLFIGYIVIAKLLVIGFVFFSTVWFNEKENCGKFNKDVCGGDIITGTSAVGMVVALVMLLIINVLFVV